MAINLFAQGPKPPPPELVLDFETTVFYGGGTSLGKSPTSAVYPCLMRKKSVGKLAVCDAVTRIVCAQTTEERDIVRKEIEQWKTVPKHENVLHLLAYLLQKETNKLPFVFYSVNERLDCDLEGLMFNNEDFAAECTYDDFLKIFQDVCDGLIHLHKNNIIHGDLKPRNVLISMGRPGHIAGSKIAAFGAGNMIEFGQGSILPTKEGPWDFVAPEVVNAPESQEDKVRSQASIDVYSLGCLMLAAVNRTKGDEDPPQTKPFGRNITWHKAGAKRSVWCGAPPGLCDVIEGCLKYNDSEPIGSDYGRPSLAKIRTDLLGMSDKPWAEENVPAYTTVQPVYEPVETTAAPAVEAPVVVVDDGVMQGQINDLRETIESFKVTQRGMGDVVKSMQGGQKDVVQIMEGMKGVVTEIKTRTMLSDKHMDRIDQALMAAAKEGNVSEVVNLLAKGATTESSDANGNSPLLLAAMGGHLSSAEALVAHGAVVNAKNKDNDTPLIWAAIGGHEPVIRFLISAGADKTAVNKRKKTAKDLAVDYERYTVVDILQA